MLKGIIYLNAAISRKLSSVAKLRDRGLIQEVFPHESVERVQSILGKGSEAIYAGFDPTADSLHVGNLLVLVGLMHFQRDGHQPIALLGGATGLIGDPSGRNSERKTLEKDAAYHNLAEIRSQIKTIFHNHEELMISKVIKKPLKNVMIVNNADWYTDLNFVEFVSSIGRHFRMGSMLSRSSVQSRLSGESGMSFTEFTYQIFQAYDWLHLYRTHHCRFQLGGNDQMGNIMSGHELISRAINKKVYGLTLPLITNEEGNKFGKSAGNAVWLSKNRSSEFSLYQFFIRLSDADAENLLKLLTFIPSNEVNDLIGSHRRNPELREAQKILADNLTLLVHGTAALEKAHMISDALYKGDINALGNLDHREMAQLFSGAPYNEFFMEPGTTMIDAAMRAKCFANEKDAHRIITAGGFYINQNRTTNPSEILTPGVHILPNGISLFRIGKKNYTIVKWV